MRCEKNKIRSGMVWLLQANYAVNVWFSIKKQERQKVLRGNSSAGHKSDCNETSRVTVTGQMKPYNIMALTEV